MIGWSEYLQSFFSSSSIYITQFIRFIGTYNDEQEFQSPLAKAVFVCEVSRNYILNHCKLWTVSILEVMHDTSNSLHQYH